MLFSSENSPVRVKNCEGKSVDAYFYWAPGQGRAQHGAANPGIGQQVCRFGRASQATRCGQVITTIGALNATNPFTGVRMSIGNQILATGIAPIPGDSGGPVFSGHIANGTITGSYHFINPSSIHHGVTATAFTGINQALAGTDTRICRHPVCS